MGHRQELAAHSRRLFVAFHPRRILDVATGTGDLPFCLPGGFSAIHHGSRHFRGHDAIGRQKVEALHLDGIIRFQHEDCEALSFADDTFDAVTVAYGVRNFEHLDQGLREMCRVLKPGGHLLIIELSSPHRFPMKQLFLCLRQNRHAADWPVGFQGP